MQHVSMARSLDGDQARAQICKAVKYGDPALLRRILFNMDPRERASALATQTLYARGGVGRVCNIICTPLVAAAEYGHLLCVKMLLYFHADVEGNNTFWTPLFAAVAGGYVDIMNCLVENGADVNARTYDNCTPLIRASALGDIDVVTFLVEHGANVNLQDKDGETALHYAVRHRRNSYNDVLSCLIKHGADVNARSNDYLTPLMLASKYEVMNAATLLVEHGADINLQDRNGETALFFGIDKSVYGVNDVLKYLVENGADVNSCTAENSTPLMIASLNGRYDAMKFLVENGASLDLQDKNGDTALHYAVRGNDLRAIHILEDLDAPKLFNKNRLTPLLFASNALMISIVEDFAGWPCLEEEEIDALELLGASLATQHFIDVRGRHTEKAFGYMKRGLKERFRDPSDHIVKKPMEPVEAYQNRKECQTLEELAQIESDVEAILMESLIIRERILGADNVELLGPIQELADWHKRCWNFDICMGLQSHAMEIAQQCDHSIESQLHSFISVIYQMVHNNSNPKRKIILKVLEQTVLEYEKQTKEMTKDLEGEPPSENMKQFLDGVKKQDIDKLLDYLLRLLQIFVRVELCEEKKELNVPELLQKLRFINPHDSCGNTLLHLSVNDRRNLTFYYPPPPFEFPCAKTIQLLLNVGINVDAINGNGDTPLHIAVAFTSSDKSHLLKDMLKVLLDGGARDDFVNNDGKTAMDVAQTEEARRILAAGKKLQ